MTASVVPPVRRLIYKQLLAGDFRKLTGSANDAATGGGARDLRLPFAAFDPIVAQILPDTQELMRKDGAVGARMTKTARSGQVHVDGPGGNRVEVLLWESPTPARPTEGRFPKVHVSGATTGLLAAAPRASDVPFVLFVQSHDGELRVHTAYASDLRTLLWAPEVSAPILAHLDDPRRRTREAVCGYLDFTTGVRYAHNLARK